MPQWIRPSKSVSGVFIVVIAIGCLLTMAASFAGTNTAASGGGEEVWEEPCEEPPEDPPRGTVWCEALCEYVDEEECPSEEQQTEIMFLLASSSGEEVEGTNERASGGLTVSEGSFIELHTSFIYRDSLLELTERHTLEIHVLRSHPLDNVLAIYSRSCQEKELGRLYGLDEGMTFGKVVLKGGGGQVFYESLPFEIHIVPPGRN